MAVRWCREKTAGSQEEVKESRGGGAILKVRLIKQFSLEQKEMACGLYQLRQKFSEKEIESRRQNGKEYGLRSNLKL